jgi:Mrp family chromosome partitioning ATPase
MISALVFSNNIPLTNYVRGVCAMSAEISIAGTLETVRTGYAIARQLSAWAPELVLLDIGEEDMKNLAGAVVLQIQTESPATAIVPICSQRGPHVRQLTETLGLVPALAPPFDSDDLEAAAIDALGATMDAKRGFLAVFAPARPGSGATTVALNAAWQVARNRSFRTLFVEVDEEIGAASILLDDEDSGPATGDDQGFVTEAGFKQQVRHLGPLHVITGVRLRALTKMKRWAVLRLVTCARSHYDFVFVRVPSLNHVSVKPLLSVSRRICITATPDVPSLAMARRRCAELREAIESARVVLVVNRCNGDLAERHFRSLLDHDNVELVPDAPRQVQQSYRESGVVEVGGPFARAIHSVASAVTGSASACPPPPSRPTMALLSRLFAPEGT